MAVRKSKLYSAFGEVIYTMAMADGAVHEQEVTVLKKIIKDHEWARGITWSFNYERKRKRDLNEVMKFATTVFQENGPSTEYDFFLDVLEKIALAHDGIVEEERQLIDHLKEEFLLY